MGRSGRIKGRSITTYQHSLKKLERSWKTLFKASQKAKTKGKVRSFYFHEKYPTVESYTKLFKIKEATK
jgi:uncharacterized membrane protein YkvA (DUF1232 family)